MFDPSQYTAPKTKQLPVFLLLDVSGSMDEVLDPENTRSTGKTIEEDGQVWELVEGGTTKMQILNEAVKNMIDSFVVEEIMEIEFLVSIITFGDKAQLHLPPTITSSVTWTDMHANGETAMGKAFSIVKTIIEDKNIIPSRAYRPMVVLVSDGAPTDKWEKPLQELIANGRSSKSFFLAMGIGEKPGIQTLERFISQTPYLADVNGTKIPNTVFHAADAKKIHEFFQKVTISVTMRSKSQNPNNIPTSSQSNSSDQKEGYL